MTLAPVVFTDFNMYRCIEVDNKMVFRRQYTWPDRLFELQIESSKESAYDGEHFKVSKAVRYQLERSSK